MGYKIKRVLVWQNNVEKQIYPATWNPGANTIAYYPLKEDFNDHKGTGTSYDLTAVGCSITSLGGVNCMVISGNSPSSRKYAWINSIPLPTGAGVRTFSMWTNNQNATAQAAEEVYLFNGVASSNQMVLLCSSNNIYSVSQHGSGASFNTTLRQQWVHLVLVYDGTKFTFYCNGVSQGKWTYTINTGSGALYLGGYGGSISAWNYYNGGLSEVILENKARTAQEVSDYYNLTKSNYGL